MAENVARAHAPGAGVSALDIGARIDRLPVWGLRRSFFVLLGLAYLFAFYDLTAIGVSLAPMLTDLGLPKSASAGPIAWGLVAYMVGAYGLGSVSDLAGRRVALRLSIVVLALGSILTAFSWNLTSLTVFRVVTGLGIGAMISLAATITGEFAGRTGRGRAVSANALWGAVGLVITPLIGLALIPFPHVGWRLVFGVGGLSAFLLLLCVDRVLPESPRWLAVKGRSAEADRIVTAMETRARQRYGGELPAPEPAAAPSGDAPDRFPTLQLFTRRLFPRLVLVVVFWVLWYLWIYGQLSYGPTILTEMGLSVPEGLVASAVGYLGFVAGGLVAPWLIERVERKYIVAGGALVAALGFVLLANASPATAVFGVLIVGFGNFVAVSSAYTYTAEIFPTGARTSAMALGDGVGHLGGAATPLLVLPLLAAAGPSGTYWALAATALLSALVISAGMRTRRRPLTEATG
jgi:MFS transporter, putative metabolite:H+ symporter